MPLGTVLRRETTQQRKRKELDSKSLVKIADVVTVLSGPYSFKLDTSTKLGNLGMIITLWVDAADEINTCGFKIPTERTLFKLRRRPNSILSFSILSSDFSFLLFCRKLKNIRLTDSRGNQTCQRREKSEQLSSDSTRLVWSWLKKKLGAIRLYAVFEHTVKNMPPEPNRPNRTESTIILAFPHEDHTPSLKINRRMLSCQSIGLDSGFVPWCFRCFCAY